MNEKSNSKIDVIMDSTHDNLGQIIAKVKVLEKIQQQFQQILEPNLAQHCKVANLRDHCLIIQTNSAAFATAIRYQTPHLLPLLNAKKEDPSISSIKCIVRPSNEKKEPPKKRLYLSKESSSILKETANYLSNHELAEALTRLSENVERRNTERS